MNRQHLTIALAVAMFSYAHNAALSQRNYRPLQLEQNVEPAFSVAPTRREIHASRGKTVTVEFQVTSVERQTTLQIRPVALRQDESGAIMPDAESPVPENLELLSPASVKMSDNETITIRATIKVPATNSKFHTYGILLTDLGRIVNRQPVGNTGGRMVGIRFITRYLLRCDVFVKGARGGNIKNLDIEAAELLEEGGAARFNVWISNPTDSPFEFEVRCRVVNPSHGTRQKSFNSYMGKMVEVNPPGRWLVHILPGARLRLLGDLPEAVFPGDYELQVDLRTNRRTRIKKTFPIRVEQGDFPAQDAAIVQIAENIKIAPRQIELSLRRGGKRFVPLELTNDSQHPITFSLKPQSNSGTPADWLVVRPDTITLHPTARRKILVMLAPNKKLDHHRYGDLHVTASDEAGVIIGQADLPVAAVSRSEEQPKLEIDATRLSFDPSRSVFRVPVINTGSMHIPLDARLTLTDGTGHETVLPGGFGRWLMPGKSAELEFRSESAPTPGKHGFHLQAISGSETEPIDINAIITIPVETSIRRE